MIHVAAAIGCVTIVSLVALAVFKRRRRQEQLVMYEKENVSEPITFSNPMLLAPELNQVVRSKTDPNLSVEDTRVTIESNPLFVASETPVFLEPDNFQDEESLVFIFKTMCQHNEGSFEQLVEHVRGTPLFGQMMKMSDDKKEHFVKLLRAKSMTEVEQVMSKLRRVNRASLSGTPTLVKQMRIQARWHRLYDSLV
jgi:hypothetical protein